MGPNWFSHSPGIDHARRRAVALAGLAPTTVVAAAELPGRGQAEPLDAWTVGELTYGIFALDTGGGFITDIRRDGLLLERRTFVATPDGVVTAAIQSLSSVEGGDLGSRIGSTRGSTTVKWLLAAGLVASIVATVVIASEPTGRRNADQAAVVSSSAPACDFPGFFPDRLPWTDQVGEPDRATKARDGSTEFTWSAPRPLPSGYSPTEVALVRRPQPAELDPVAATGTARGHPVRVVLVGDEGVGSVRMFWREASRDCESYELSIDRGINLEDALSLLPR